MWRSNRRRKKLTCVVADAMLTPNTYTTAHTNCYIGDHSASPSQRRRFRVLVPRQFADDDALVIPVAAAIRVIEQRLSPTG